MLSEKIQKALNQQVNAELYSSYLYLSMAAYFESLSLKGFAQWMRVQAQEELVHVGKFFNYLADRGGRVLLGAIAAPPAEWSTPKEAFEDALAHEQKVTGLINKLVTLAKNENDHATENFLQWFVSEQVEEEASADEVVQKLKLVGKSVEGLLYLDDKLGTRTFVMAPAAGE